MDKLILTFKDVIHVINHKEILYCKSENSYASICLVDKKEFVVAKSLSKIHSELNSHKFIKVNQSYLINIEHVGQINKKDKLIELANSINIPFTIKIKDLLNYLNEATEEEGF